MLQNSPFLLYKLKMSGGMKFEVDYKMDAEQGLQVQSTTFDPFTNTCDESKVEVLNDLLHELNPHVAFFLGAGIPAEIMFNYLIEVEGADLLEVPRMERYTEMVNQQSENPFYSRFHAREYKPFESLFSRIAVNSLELDAYQQTVKIGATFYPPNANNITLPVTLAISIKDEFPGQKCTGYVFYKEVRRILVEIQTLLCELVSQSLKSQKRQLDLFDAGTYSNGYFDEPAAATDHHADGGQGFNLADDLEGDIEHAAKELAMS
jgi:hypothetical protein